MCKIIPIVGGAIGGAISAVMAILGLVLAKGFKEFWKKIIVLVGFFLANYLILFILAKTILEVVS